MSPLLNVQSLSKSYGTQRLFSNISLSIYAGEKVGLLGPNGAGKSTFLKILMGLESPEKGQVVKRNGISLGYASQMPVFPSKPIESVLVEETSLGTVEDRLTKARILLGKAQFSDCLQDASLLSGGWKKRLDILRALMHAPDLLLLDEPTNHLDLEGILWLEKFLIKERLSYIIVSHDRYFLKNVAEKVIELNRCFPQGVFISEGSYQVFETHKAAFLSALAQEERGLSSQLREELEWLRRSPKARTTKSTARIAKAHALMDEVADFKERNKVSQVDLSFTASERMTRKLIAAKNISKSLGHKELFKGVDITLSPGTRLGIVGKNGTGKTTLLKILSGAVAQDGGTVKYADDLKLVYFDQHREHIPSETLLRYALSPCGDYVNYQGRQIHVHGWAKKFLFSPEKLSLPINRLSGGERARILIAKLMLEPADVLFLDEPTNDLDIQTLEVIEENLMEFRGAVVLISHDRCLMDRLCTSILVLGEAQPQFFASYSQWEQLRTLPSVTKKEAKNPPVSSSSRPKSLTYAEKKELENIESTILTLEESILHFRKQLELDEVMSNAAKALDIYRSLAEVEATLEAKYERWQMLETRKNHVCFGIDPTRELS